MKKVWYVSARVVVLAIFATTLWRLSSYSGQKVEFYIITPSYNNVQKGVDGVPLCIANIKSVVQQNYQNWHMFIIDDASPDGTGQLIKEYIDSENLSHKITLIRNEKRRGAMENLYTTIHEKMKNDEAIVVCLDGDDELLNSEVLNELSQIYADRSIWLTYGNFLFHPSYQLGFCRPYPPAVIASRTYRSYIWLASHLRTFKVWLFKKIEKKDCMYDGKFYDVNCDQAIMLPMLEMASPNHFRFISKPLYLYKETEINDFKVFNDSYRMKILNHIRSLPVYAQIQGE